MMTRNGKAARGPYVRWILTVVGLFLALACTATAVSAGNGIFQTGYGLPARGMGGAATGMPLSPNDAVAFNPGGLTRFKGFHFDSATTILLNVPGLLAMLLVSIINTTGPSMAARREMKLANIAGMSCSG